MAATIWVCSSKPRYRSSSSVARVAQPRRWPGRTSSGFDRGRARPAPRTASNCRDACAASRATVRKRPPEHPPITRDVLFDRSRCLFRSHPLGRRDGADARDARRASSRAHAADSVREPRRAARPGVRLDPDRCRTSSSARAVAAIASSMRRCLPPCSMRSGLRRSRHSARVVLVRAAHRIAAHAYVPDRSRFPTARLSSIPASAVSPPDVPVALADGRGRRATERADALDGARRRVLGAARTNRRQGRRLLGLDARSGQPRRFRRGQPLHGDASRLVVRQPHHAARADRRRLRFGDEP